MISPCLFNMYIDNVVRKTMERFSGGVKVEG